MTESAKNIGFSELKNETNIPFMRTKKRSESLKEPRKYLNLNNILPEDEPKSKINKDLQILNLITDSLEKRNSIKTSLNSSCSEKFEYDLCMINKFDEKLYTSLSFISEFDLESDSKENDSFNSIQNDSCIEEIEIKTNEKILDNIDREIFDFEFDKEWEHIQDELLNKESI